MKTISKSSASSSLDSALIKPNTNILPFGSGYRQYLLATASMDQEEPAGPLMKQPLRYLGAVEPLGSEASGGWQEASGQAETLSLRDAVIALRQKILIS